MIHVSAVVEGDVDAAVIRRIVSHCGLELSDVHVKGGKQNIRSKIVGYNRAAEFVRFVVLVDLDREYGCAPELIRDWLQERNPGLTFRVAVHSVEAWLLADRQRLAQFLRVNGRLIPDRPEEIVDPKRALVEIARESRNAEVRADMVPRPGSGRAVGAAYSSRLIEFIAAQDGWRPAVAAGVCPSLDRCLRALRSLA
jgi:hypothetical protein